MYFYDTEKECALCGKVSEYSVVGGGHADGTDSLDFRMCGPLGSALGSFISCCPHCGYVAYDISEPIEKKDRYLKIVNSEGYQTCDGHPFHAKSTMKYYRLFLLQSFFGTMEDRIDALLSAAWCADDDPDGREDAIFLRRKLLPYIRHILRDESLPLESDEHYLLIAVDVLRRLSKFEEAADLCKSYPLDPNTIEESARKFQMYLCDKKDDRGYDFGSAIEMFPPANVDDHPEIYKNYEYYRIFLYGDNRKESHFSTLQEVLIYQDDPDFDKKLIEYSFQAPKTYRTLYEMVDTFADRNDRMINFAMFCLADNMHLTCFKFERILEDSRQRYAKRDKA